MDHDVAAVRVKPLEHLFTTLLGEKQTQRMLLKFYLQGEQQRPYNLQHTLTSLRCSLSFY